MSKRVTELQGKVFGCTNSPGPIKPKLSKIKKLRGEIRGMIAEGNLGYFDFIKMQDLDRYTSDKIEVKSSF